MGLGGKNDQKDLDALTSVRARDLLRQFWPITPPQARAWRVIFLRLLLPNPTVWFGSAEKNLFNALHRVKYPSVCEFTA
jgi:hypothetical protein